MPNIGTGSVDIPKRGGHPLKRGKIIAQDRQKRVDRLECVWHIFGHEYAAGYLLWTMERRLIGSLKSLSPGKITVLVACAAGQGRTMVLKIDRTAVQEKEIFVRERGNKTRMVELSFWVEIDAICLMSISDKVSGEEIPPGEFIYAPVDGEFSTPVDLSLSFLDVLVKTVIGDSLSGKLLKNNTALLMSWLGLAIDKSIDLKRDAESAVSELRSSVEKAGGLGDTLPHFIELLQSKFPPINIPVHSNPIVSIVIPVFNKFILVYDCISSMLDHFPATAFEVIIVDDSSTDETLLAKLVFTGGITILRNQDNLGFIGSCNAGAALAKGKYIFFLNNDTILKPDWLDALVGTFSDRDDAGIVGSRLLFEDGSLQECGGLVWRDASGWNFGRALDPVRWSYRFLRKTDYVSGAALMIPRNLFESVGGFDTLYTPAYYEDTDLCFKVRRLGRAVYVQPASTIIHLEGKSNGTDVRYSVKRFQQKNQQTFLATWRDILSKHQSNGSDVQSATYRYYIGHVLFIDDTVLTPDRDAGSNAALEHVLSLMRLGYHVTFIPADNMAEIQPYTKNLERLGVEFIAYPYFLSVEDYLAKSEHVFDVVYIHRYTNAKKYMSIIQKNMPQAAVLYNVADLHFLRDFREARLLAAPSESMTSTEGGEELDLISQADCTIVHSSFEQAYALELRPEARIVTAPWAVQTVQEVVPFEQREGMGFIGGFRHRPNVDAVVWFLGAVMPFLRGTGIKFFVAGSDMPASLQSLADAQVVMLGHVADEKSFMEGRRLSVAPLRYGAGLKGKVLTSFAQGTPCVMTSVAAEGFELTPLLKDLVSDDPKRLAENIIQLHNDEKLWTEACWDSIEVMDAGFSKDRVDTEITAAIHLAKTGVAARTTTTNERSRGDEARVPSIPMR